jgi:hypothetical protein
LNKKAGKKKAPGGRARSKKEEENELKKQLNLTLLII